LIDFYVALSEGRGVVVWRRFHQAPEESPCIAQGKRTSFPTRKRNSFSEEPRLGVEIQMVAKEARGSVRNKLCRELCRKLRRFLETIRAKDGSSAESVGTLRPSPVLKTDEAGGLSVTK